MAFVLASALASVAWWSFRAPAFAQPACRGGEVLGGVCICPRGRVLRGGACVRPGPTCAAGEHVSGGHCCGVGHEWVPAQGACVCLDANRCGGASSPAAPPPGAGGACPSGMVSIPGGTFSMGSTTPPAQPDEAPIARVTVSTYCLDRTEVTVDAYAACVNAGQCTAPDTTSESCNWDRGRGNHPVNCVNWNQAVAYCSYVGGRLPTEAEWEYAARGSDGRVYPWGNSAPDASRGNYCDGACAAYMVALGNPGWTAMPGVADPYRWTAPVGSFPGGRSPSGLEDMSGNVWEWVADWYGAYPGGDVRNPSGAGSGQHRVIRGGGWFNFEAVWVRASARFPIEPGFRNIDIGFRCARGGASPDPTPAAGGQCPGGRVLIPGGTFSMGSSTSPADPDEAPITRVTLSAYCMDRTEVTVDAYAACVGSGVCTEPNADADECNWNRDRGNHPVNCVDWNQAATYCNSVGGRLPTEAEWEYGARGGDGRAYPWGSAAPDDDRLRWSGGCGSYRCAGGTVAVGSYPTGRSPFGLDDMAGNVWEWVSNWYGPYPGGSVRNPTGPDSGNARVGRGACWDNDSATTFRTTQRFWAVPEVRAGYLGFRCVGDVAR